MSTAVQQEPVLLISDLCEQLEDYLEPEQVAEVYRAYLFGAEAHEGQQRLSGEPYIYHPLAVAQILAELRLDHESLVAGVLHDTLEDTRVAKEDIAAAFSEEVAELVDGVSKLTQVHFSSKAEAEAENFRKMMLAMARDLRVILIKLADRLHNMRTLGVMRPDKRRRIARETLDIYAPIANRLGMNSLRLELEDLGFRALHPMRYRILSKAVQRARGNRKEVVARIEGGLKARLAEEGLEGRVEGREKHLYSIYRKMRDKHLAFQEVFDVYAFRVVVDRVDTCYRVLGAVHNLYKPVPGRFKDYIAIPKANGYQSLHTVLFSPWGVPIEIQIRTRDMDRVAEAGIAAHWLYKTGNEAHATVAQTRAREWLRELLEMQQNAGNSMEFLENVKVDLFPDEVYVFTPKGQIMELPRGATAVDYAYAVHSDVGNTCVGARIDRRLMPLNTRLLNGQTVEIVTAPGAHPNPAWLNFVITGKARTAIRAYLKDLQADEAVALGRRLLERALSARGESLEGVDRQQLDRVVTELGAEDPEGLFRDIGLGRQLPALVAQALAPVAVGGGETSQPLTVRGTEGMVVSFAKCCHPIPGDAILGFMSAGRGLVIHRRGCRNVVEDRHGPEKWMHVAWSDEASGEFPVELRVEVANRRGVLATVAATIAELEANIENVDVEDRDGVHSALLLTVSVRDRVHLARIMRRIRKVESVARITRY
ncbi:GTP pyrophosphokinase [Thiohalospira halophila DSM 15071]|uniref:guanosine-3',5'-bis(diphosphate) 3'-diphosphatase n=1 Tax=Thiohalospira halophila DSM 15071 TaxID=1123397 RepID=A0A1I1Q027_9GAMM|nr:bifunctional GTP diphosphokinase/guanosine-3',5'-bis pyrophosphate 3'-pyrophosphohydrolase [Thiohalospira halophila]SFD15272.1 GTP pyrophosphokinase [Thiohalospira halophila DSM 15071]